MRRKKTRLFSTEELKALFDQNYVRSELSDVYHEIGKDFSSVIDEFGEEMVLNVRQKHLRDTSIKELEAFVSYMRGKENKDSSYFFADQYHAGAIWLLREQLKKKDWGTNFQIILDEYGAFFYKRYYEFPRKQIVDNLNRINAHPTDELHQAVIATTLALENVLSIENNGPNVLTFAHERTKSLMIALDKRRAIKGSFDDITPADKLDKGSLATKIPGLPSIYSEEDLGKIFDQIWQASAEPKIFYKEDREIFLSQFTDSPMGKVRVNASVRSAQTGIFDLYKEITQEKWNVSRMNLYISPSKTILAKWNKPRPVTFIREILRPFNTELLLKKLKEK